MKKIQNTLIVLLGFMSAFVIGMYTFEHKEAIADVLGLRTIANQPGENATSTVSVLRYATNGATTTLPMQTINGTNQNGFSTGDAESITLAYQTVGSTSPYSMRLHVEYGYDIPMGTSTNRSSIEWFQRNYLVSGEGVGYNATTSSSFAASIGEYASTTPMRTRSNLGTATTSEVVDIPTLNAKYMRIHAVPLGSNAMFWLNAIIRDYKH